MGVAFPFGNLIPTFSNEEKEDIFPLLLGEGQGEVRLTNRKIYRHCFSSFQFRNNEMEMEMRDGGAGVGCVAKTECETAALDFETR